MDIHFQDAVSIFPMLEENEVSCFVGEVRQHGLLDALAIFLNRPIVRFTHSQLAMIGARLLRISTDEILSPDKVANAVSVSSRTLQRAVRLLKSGDIELIKAVDQGKLAVQRAFELTRNLSNVQRQEVAAANKGVSRRSPDAKAKGSIGKQKFKNEASDASQFAVMAISQLERIRNDDPRKNEALARVQNWIRERL